MTITMNGYDFNSSRVGRVLSATSLSQAQDMGPLDSLMDWARGGVKREAIAKLYNQISQAGADGKPSPPSRQLARFEALRALVTDENLSKFQVKTKVDTATNTWGYEFLIDRTRIASQDKLPFENGRDYADFNGALRAWLTTADWFPEAHQEEAKECMRSMYTDMVTDRQKVESFQRLQELVGEAHKSRFQASVEIKPAAYKAVLGLTDDSVSSPGEKHTLYTLALGIEGVKDFSLEQVSPAMDVGFAQRSLEESRADDSLLHQLPKDAEVALDIEGVKDLSSEEVWPATDADIVQKYLDKSPADDSLLDQPPKEVNVADGNLLHLFQKDVVEGLRQLRNGPSILSGVIDFQKMLDSWSIKLGNAPVSNGYHRQHLAHCFDLAHLARLA